MGSIENVHTSNILSAMSNVILKALNRYSEDVIYFITTFPCMSSAPVERHINYNEFKMFSSRIEPDMLKVYYVMEAYLDKPKMQRLHLLVNTIKKKKETIIDRRLDPYLLSHATKKRNIIIVELGKEDQKDFYQKFCYSTTDYYNKPPPVPFGETINSFNRSAKYLLTRLRENLIMNGLITRNMIDNF